MSSVLICSTPVHGHVTPLLAVARHLVEAGVRVRFLSGRRYRDVITATGAQFLPLPVEADFDDSDLDAGFPGRVGLSGTKRLSYDLITIFLQPIPAQLRAVRDAIAAEPVDAVLCESLFAGALALVTEPRSGRPAVVNLGILPLSLKSRDTAPFGLGILPMRGPVGRIRNALLGFVAEKMIFASAQKEAERRVREASGRRLERFFMSWPTMAEAIVQFTVEGFEYPRSDLPSMLRFVGPVSRSVPSNVPVPDWWGELDGSRPVVHVTQGTIANTSWDELVAPAMEGLAGLDALVVVSTGGRSISTLPHPLPANVRVAEYLPYDELLPRTDVMVTNGGYGGVHYALEQGVPLVVAGRTEDKIEVSARVEWTGAGINLKTNKPTPAQVVRAVSTVLSSDGYRKSAARIGAEITASPGPAGIVSMLESWASEPAGTSSVTEPASD